MSNAKQAATGRTIKLEGAVQVVIMLAIGGAAGAASFTHVHNVAAAHGQGGWLGWADAVVLELMSLASGLELRHRKRHRKPVGMPAAVLVVAVVLSLSAQVVEAEPSVIGWIAAALPAAGFLAMVKIALGHSTPQMAATVDEPPASDNTPSQRWTDVNRRVTTGRTATGRRRTVRAPQRGIRPIGGTGPGLWTDWTPPDGQTGRHWRRRPAPSTPPWRTRARR